MPKLLSQDAIEAYNRDGLHFPIPVMSREEAQSYRDELETYEGTTGAPIQGAYRHKVHLLFTWADRLIRHPKVLDAVEDVIGPDILCWSTNFFIKEPRTGDFVSWHQDSTYWGLDPADVVTAWIALTDVPMETGPMRFLLGSQTLDQVNHKDSFHENNLLTRGQVVDMDIDEDKSVFVPLSQGEMSLHHIRAVHASDPNTFNDRRIGFAVRYMPTYVRSISGPQSATLVRGTDTYGHFGAEEAPVVDLDEAALALHAKASGMAQANLYRGTDRTEFRP